MLQDSTETTPARLLELARAGDADSMHKLLSGHLGYLQVVLRSRWDTRLQARLNASDVIQETLFEAHRDFDQFCGSSPQEFTGWLRKILIHNVARAVEMHMQAGKRDLRREQLLEHIDRRVDQSQQALAALLADHRRSPASEAEHQEALLGMARAIEDLPGEYRQVIELRHLEGLAFPEIAVRMQRSPGATRMLWLRAIGRLRELMD